MIENHESQIINNKSKIVNRKSGIYIHIPFCGKRCNYCDFYLITNLNVIEKFLVSLKKEISMLSSSLNFNKESFDTIFFGGGTPSLLSALQIEDLLNYLYKNFSIGNGSEISMEANPEDFLERSLSDYGSAGINRISFGVQSFLDPELKFLTRQHSSADAQKVIKDAIKYFDNINLDIIYSLPSQTVNDLDYSLTRAIELEPKHISAYTLTFEKRTALYRSFQKNLVKKNTSAREAEMFEFVSQKLSSAGFHHYEVSNFAKKGHECKHNLKYWQYENYVGLGPSAHSMLNYERWNNYRDIVKYNTMTGAGQLPVEEKYELSDEQKKLEFIMLSLRSAGIYFEKYMQIFGVDFEKANAKSMKELIDNGYSENTGKIFRLTEKGYALADEIIAKYF